MQLYHQQLTIPTQQQLATVPSTANATIAAFNLTSNNLSSMTSGTVNSLINTPLSSLISTNQQLQTTMTTTSQTNINSVLNAQLNALGLNLNNLTNLANLENTGDYQNTLLNQLNQNSSLLNRTNGTSLDSLISNADSLSPSSVHSNINTIANQLNLNHHHNNKLTKSASAQNKQQQQQQTMPSPNLLAAATAANGQTTNPNLLNELLNYYDLRKLYENMPYLNALYPALFGSSPLLRDQHALAYKQTLQGKFFF